MYSKLPLFMYQFVSNPLTFSTRTRFAFNLCFTTKKKLVDSHPNTKTIVFKFICSVQKYCNAIMSQAKK